MELETSSSQTSTQNPLDSETDQPAWHESEVLSDLISQAVDLESACQHALNFILETAGRPSGALMVMSDSSTAPELVVHKGLSISWAAQISDPNSALNQLAHKVFISRRPISGQQLEDTEPVSRLAAALPIVAGGELLGVILVKGEACSAREIERLARLMPPVGRAIRMGRWQCVAQNQTRNLATLQNELAQLSYNTDFDGLRTHLLHSVLQLLNAEASQLVLLDPTQQNWIMRESLGVAGELNFQVNPREGNGLLRECLRSGQPLRLNTPLIEDRLDPLVDSLDGLQPDSMLCAPLIANGQTIGVIQVLNKRPVQSGTGPARFDEDDQDVLSILASMAATAMHNTRLIQQYKVNSADLEASRWELLNSRNTLRALFDNLPFALYIIDQNFNLAAVNMNRSQRAGKSPQVLVGQPCYQALFGHSSSCPECQVQKTFSNGIQTKRNEQRQVSPEESLEWEISSFPILDENEQVTQAILLEQDATERYHLESILAQSEKLAAVGQLAAGVAHEINNPLTAIIANAQILHRELPPNHDLQESVDLIARAGARATQVVRNLLDFARKEDYHLGLTDINDTLERALELVQHEMVARGVRLEFRPDPNLPHILASQDHLQSVWLNLILNATDALDKTPGEIHIATRRLSSEIQVSVHDNGKGIPPERLTRIFEPFYTTKAPGRGTGLGLSVSNRIVKQHGGYIRVESQIGAGSTFTVVLPLS